MKFLFLEQNIIMHLWKKKEYKMDNIFGTKYYLLTNLSLNWHLQKVVMLMLTI